MRENRTSGSVAGTPGNRSPYAGCRLWVVSWPSLIKGAEAENGHMADIEKDIDRPLPLSPQNRWPTDSRAAKLLFLFWF